jgi:hypothetical protein
MTGQVTFAAISYAHGTLDSEVLALSDRLNRDGVDCEVDLYDGAPPEGWARWMEAMMTRRTVLVIASEDYYRRYHRQEPSGVGLGATFETGLLAQRVVEMQGKNEGIIPVLLAGSDAQFIPEFLRDVARYDLSESGGYGRLYRRLTGQAQFAKPPLGKVRVLSPENELEAYLGRSAPAHDAIALFYSDDGMFGARILEADRGVTLKLTLAPGDEGEMARLRALPRQQHFGVAYGSIATFARVKSSRERMAGGNQQYELDLAEELVDNSFGSEMSYNGISADDLAEMRARRILLDERLKRSETDNWSDRLNDMTFESFVAGRIAGGNRLSVNSSPIPLLMRSSTGSLSELLPVARLTCVMLLILTGTVEHITRLDMTLANSAVEVRFEGVRHKAYSNCEPTVISVTGTCQF